MEVLVQKKEVELPEQSHPVWKDDRNCCCCCIQPAPCFAGMGHFLDRPIGEQQGPTSP